MKIVINTCFGGFEIADEWRAKNCKKGCGGDCRECAKLIQAIEAKEQVNDSYSELDVVEFPDDATDWEIEEYDGLENVLYVQGGKICRAYGGEDD